MHCNLSEARAHSPWGFFGLRAHRPLTVVSLPCLSYPPRYQHAKKDHSHTRSNLTPAIEDSKLASYTPQAPAFQFQLSNNDSRSVTPVTTRQLQPRRLNTIIATKTTISGSSAPQNNTHSAWQRDISSTICKLIKTFA
jgi:hypothetical protein